MNTLREFQNAFRSAVLSQPGGLGEADIAPGNIPFSAAMAIYRNNVFAKLTDALGDLYPIVKRLVGDEFFAYAAGDFSQAHLPRSPVLAGYGDEFPGFLDGFAAAQSTPYLGDMARLELARHQATHAADCEAMDTGNLKDIAPEAIESVSFEFHPSCRLLCSAYPVKDIWEAHNKDADIDRLADLPADGAKLLILRVGEKIEMRELDSAGFDFVTALMAGKTLGAAFKEVGGEWSPQEILTELFGLGAVANINLSGGNY